MQQYSKIMEWIWIFNKNIFNIDSYIFFNEKSNNINNTKTLKTLKNLDSIYNKSFNPYVFIQF